jgi:peptidoglycan/xylan/chitin deacetylase (PgdA/CDA1 family)
MNHLPAREHLRSAYAQVLQGIGVVDRSRRALRNRSLVLMYHRVLADHEVSPEIKPGMYVTSHAFERHLAYLADNHDVVGLDDLHEWLHGRRQYSRIPCVITFDDGWVDNYTNAFPLLKKYGLSATIFLITDEIGTPGMLTWAQVREMEAAGIDFGSHTATHPVLTTTDEPRTRDELTRSRERLQRELRRPSRWFCYPKGAYNDQALRIARELYVGALSTREGPVAPGEDLHHLRRIGIHNDVTRTTALFACRLVSLV